MHRNDRHDVRIGQKVPKHSPPSIELLNREIVACCETGLSEKKTPPPFQRFTPSEARDLLSIFKAEQRDLHKKLKAFEKEFFQKHHRHVQTPADLREKANDYRRYKDIKKDIEDLKARSKESPIPREKAQKRSSLDPTDVFPHQRQTKRLKNEALQHVQTPRRIVPANLESKAHKVAKGLLHGLQTLQSECFFPMVDDHNWIHVVRKVDRLLKLQNDFEGPLEDSYVDIAYHHTRKEHLSSIQTHGLLSLPERIAKKVSSRYNGSKYGEGIYCSVDPILYAGSRFGDATILLARWKGTVGVHPKVNTFVHHKINVLRSSDQCIPLYWFPSENLNNRNFRALLKIMEYDVQNLLDDNFHEQQSRFHSETR